MADVLLDIAIGLVTVFAVFALLASGIEGWWAGRRNLRGRFLRDELSRMFDGAPLLRDRVLSHPLWREALTGTKADGVRGDLGKLSRRRFPAYLGAQTFARAVYDSVHLDDLPDAAKEVAEGLAKERTGQRVKLARGTAKQPTRGAALIEEVLVRLEAQSWLDDAKVLGEAKKGRLPRGDPTVKQRLIAAWFNGRMERLGDRYRGGVRRRMFWCALAVAVLLNVNTVGLAMSFYQDGNLRAEAAAEGVALTEGRLGGPLPFPVGWSADTWPLSIYQENLSGADLFVVPLVVWVLAVLGWGVTAAAASLGAPFWFDALQRLVAVRRGRQVSEPVGEGVSGVPGVPGGVKKTVENVTVVVGEATGRVR